MSDRCIGGHSEVDFVKQRSSIDESIIRGIDLITQVQSEHSGVSRAQLFPSSIFLK